MTTRKQLPIEPWEVTSIVSYSAIVFIQGPRGHWFVVHSARKANFHDHINIVPNEDMVQLVIDSS